MIKNQKNHIQKGDVVKIISGGQKGLLGKIQTVLKKKSSVIVEGVLPRIKYLKNNREKQQEDSKKIELPILIHISNVMLWDKENNQVSRIGYKKIESNIENLKNQQNEIKKRYFKKSGALIPLNNINEGKN
jgi:large subunit ribosomal protein L24